MKFTDQIATYIKENNLDVKHLTIVLPSERAKKYISASLFKAYQKPMIAPKMITIDRWVRDLSDKTVIDKTRVLIRLFAIQLKSASSIEDHSFDEFLTWGNMLLSDFDELDRYLLDSKQLFSNLADIKEIENWSFGNENLTESQKRFMEFWDRLPGYYTELNKVLDAEKVCYMGKAYRYVCENLDVVFKEDKDSKFLFAGFNALSPAEVSIMKQLHKMGRGHILINADKFYLNTESHEAGRFMRDLKQELGISNLSFVENRLLTEKKDIEIIECAQTAGQAKVAGTLLDEMDPKLIDQTLVLLADESLIVPVLKNLPKKIGKANITLGLPLRNTALRTWVDLLFGIQENKLRFKSEGIYFNDLQKLWNHPFVNAILTEEEKANVVRIEHEIIKRNSIFLSLKNIEIGEIGNKIMQLVFKPWKNDWLEGLLTIRELSRFIYKYLEEAFDFEKAILEGFDRALIDFENISKEGLPEMNLRSFKTLFNQHWNLKNIAYHGNPMEGLQIMGLLETRLLDFENIICVGMNEGSMPPTNPIQTMVPMDLRQYFGLPTPREKQGLFAHHFYRLLHHCNKMYVTYTSAQEKIGSNEASRYLLQLELELSRLNTNINIQKKFYSIPNETVENKQTVVQKTPEILERLDEIFAHSTSASMLKKFATCSLDFYYQYVMEFGEEEKVEEEVENNTFGTFIHNALEEMYQPFARFNKRGEKIDPAPPAITSFDMDNMLKHYEYEIDKQFYNHFNHDKEAYATGKNFLSYKMALELTKRFLEKEKEFLMEQTSPVFIESLERELRADVEIEVLGVKKKVHLKGFIDRIDSIDGKFRIIDYKSGKVKKEDTSTVKKVDLEKVIQGCLGKKHVLQLIMYCYLFKVNLGELPREASIISFINIQDGVLPLETGDMALAEVVDLFPSILEAIINQIYDVEVPFLHDDSKQFSYCAYC
jgi:ATP-dependent helicase/nuclease subunit B